MASSTEVTYSTYENWFASAPFHELPAEHAALWTSSFHLLGGLKRSHLLAVVRFQLGAHDLRLVSGKSGIIMDCPGLYACVSAAHNTVLTMSLYVIGIALCLTRVATGTPDWPVGSLMLGAGWLDL
jgi:hypothetical protein